MLRTRLRQTHSALLAWLLLLTLAPQLVVKTFHYHAPAVDTCACNHEVAAAACHDTPADTPLITAASAADHACSICDFVLSFATEPTFEEFGFYPPFVRSREASPVAEESHLSPAAPALRGPPAC